MTWESIGSTDTGQMPNDQAWIELSLALAKRYVAFTCGEPPLGSKLDVMWHDHEHGSYPSLGVWSEYDPSFKYIHACEHALEVFNEAVSWYALKENAENQIFADEEDDSESDGDS